MTDGLGDSAPDQWEGPPGHMRPVSVQRPSRSRKWLFITIGVVAGILLVGGGAYVLLQGRKGPAPAPSSAASSQQQASAEEPATPANSGPQTYKSAKLNMEFTYPEGWSMKENNDKTVITLTSSPTTYPKKDGTSTSGVFTLRLRNGLVPDAMKTTIQSAVAMKDSEIIAYSNPTDQQRQYTNVSFGGNGPNTNFFIVSGSVAFKTGEAFGSNIDLEGAVYLFTGGYGKDAGDTLGFDGVPKASFEGPAYQQALGIVKSLKIY